MKLQSRRISLNKTKFSRVSSTSWTNVERYFYIYVDSVPHSYLGLRAYSHSSCLAHAHESILFPAWASTGSSQTMLSDLTKLLDRAETLQVVLVQRELGDWQRRQQRACIGAPDNVCLDQLEKWYGLLPPHPLWLSTRAGQSINIIAAVCFTVFPKQVC